jgi:molybdopterin-guanine dinucleotide biosynthesis protein B
MLPVVSIVGQSQSGKTTLMERLIAEFKRRGCRVAAVKHASQDFDMDKPGKDTWRYAEVGGDAVVISSPHKLAMLRPHDNNDSIDEVLRLLGEEFDIVLVEGFHGEHVPKIEVHRKALKQGLRCEPEELKAVVTDEPLDIDRPQYSPKDISGVADFIEERIIGERGDETVLYINGSAIMINKFAQQIFSNALIGMALTLKGVEDVRTLQISVRKR